MGETKDYSALDAVGSHYVYVYRDVKGRVRYVGYGRELDRPTSRNRRAPMLEFLSQGKYTLEIAGPYGSKETGIAVETALISLLRPDLNSSRAPGPTRLQFRPLGVPEAFSERLGEPPLTHRDLTTLDNGRACPLLFVRISNLDFEGEDARKGYSLDKPLSDPDILARIDRWWQIGRHVKAWEKDPRQSPKVLVGVTGPRLHRIIIGAVAVDPRGWHAAQPTDGQLYQVPTLETSNLDAHRLRGRLLSPEINIKFGAIRSQFFVLLGCDGQTVGGQR